jgi:hypothetical protein
MRFRCVVRCVEQIVQSQQQDEDGLIEYWVARLWCLRHVPRIYPFHDSRGEFVAQTEVAENLFDLTLRRRVGK